MTLDLKLILDLIAIASVNVAIFLFVYRRASNLKLQLQDLRHENKLQNIRLDSEVKTLHSALRLLEVRQRELERYLEKELAFVPQYLRREGTGAPWLNDQTEN